MTKTKAKNDDSAMVIETMPIKKLENDPRNAREHGHHNLEAIKESLSRWGQQKPIVIDHNNVVIAGNGTLAAARELKWNNIDVVRTDLSEPEQVGYAIADNRTAELAEWDEIQLATTLQEIAKEDIASTGFSHNDLNTILNRISKTLDLRMDEDGEEGNLVHNPNMKTDAPASHVRMVQLYFDTESIEVYLDLLKLASEVFGTDNPTDTVIQALRQVVKHEDD